MAAQHPVNVGANHDHGDRGVKRAKPKTTEAKDRGHEGPRLASLGAETKAGSGKEAANPVAAAKAKAQQKQTAAAHPVEARLLSQYRKRGRRRSTRLADKKKLKRILRFHVLREKRGMRWEFKQHDKIATLITSYLLLPGATKKLATYRDSFVFSLARFFTPGGDPAQERVDALKPFNPSIRHAAA